MKERTKTIFNISHGITAKLISVFVSLLVLPIIFKNLGAENYGWIGVYTILLGSFYVFDLGISNLVTKELTQSRSKEIDKNTIFHSLEFIYYIIGIGILILICFSAPTLARYWFSTAHPNVENSHYILQLIGIAIFVQWPHSFYSASLYGFDRQFSANNIQIILSIIKNLILIILFHFAVITLNDFFFFQIFISSITTVILRIQIAKELNSIHPFRNISFSYLLSLRNFVFGLGLIGIFGFIYYDLTNILLSKWLSLSEFGLYSIVFTVAGAFILITSSIKNSAFPDISANIHSELKSIQNSYQMHFNIMSYLCIPIAIFIFMHSHLILSIWLNSAMADQLNFSLKFIALGSLFYSLMIIPWSYLIAFHKSKYLMYQTAILAIISLPLIYFLVSNYRLEGASMYWVLINFIPSILMIFYVQKILFNQRFLNLFFGIIYPFGLSILFYGSYYILTQKFNFSLLIHILISILSSSIIYIMLSIRLKSN